MKISLKVNLVTSHELSVGLSQVSIVLRLGLMTRVLIRGRLALWLEIGDARL